MLGVATTYAPMGLDPSSLDVIERRYHVRQREQVIRALEKFPAYLFHRRRRHGNDNL